MRKYILFLITLFISSVLLGQTVAPTNFGLGHSSIKIDSAKKEVSETIDSAAKVIHNVTQKQIAEYKESITEKYSNFSTKQKERWDKFQADVEKRRKQKIQYNFSIESESRYQSEIGLSGEPGVLSNLNLNTNMLIGGFPLAFDYSFNYGTETGFKFGRNDLFKFDLNKERYLRSFKDQLKRYSSLKNSGFKGLDVSEFAKKAFLSKLTSLYPKSSSPVTQRLVSYLQNTSNIREILSLEDIQIKEKLLSLIDVPVGVDAGKLNALKEGKYQEVLKDVNIPGNVKLEDIRNGNYQGVLNREKEKLSKVKADGENLVSGLDSIEKNPSLLFAKSNALFSSAGKYIPDSLKQDFAASDFKKDIDSLVAEVNKIRGMAAARGLDLKQMLSFDQYFMKDGKLDEGRILSILSANTQNKFLKTTLTQLNDLRTGDFASKLPGSVLNHDVFMKGAQFTVKTKTGPLSMGVGSLKDIGLVKDAGFDGSIYSSPRNLSYISIGTNNSLFAQGKLSWTSSSTGKSENTGLAISSMSRNTMAFTFSQLLNMKSFGNITIDLSKSFSVYRNTFETGSETVLIRKNLFGTYLSDDSFETISLGINHDFASKKLGLTSDLYFSYAGMGYQNPASLSMGQNTLRFGGNFKKKMFKNRLQFNVRADMRNRPTNFTSNEKWQNHQIQLDGRFQISRNYNISVKYNTSGMDKNTVESSSSVYSSEKVQVDANASYKINNVFNVSHLSIGNQSLNNKYVSPVSGRFATLNYIHTMSMKQNSLTATVFYNKELSSVKLIGDMLNTDIGLQYLFFKKINSSTAVTFLSNEQTARQVGVRQNIQLISAKHFDFSTDIDIRKNLIKPLYPDLYPTYRVDLSVKYYLKRD